MFVQIIMIGDIPANVLKYYNAVVGVHSSPVIRTYVLLASWLPVHMNEAQNRAVPSSFAFYRCVLKRTPAIRPDGSAVTTSASASAGASTGASAGRSVHRKLNVPLVDTCLLSAAEVVQLRETYDFVAVTSCASENDVHAVVHAIRMHAGASSTPSRTPSNTDFSSSVKDR